MKKEITNVPDIMSIPPEQRLKHILASQDQKALVQSMPEEDVWIMIKKAGIHDCLPVLENTTTEQLQYILDIELWRKDRFLPEQSLEWLSYIKECGQKKVLEWIYNADADSVILTFKNFVHIDRKESPEDNPLEREWPGEVPPSTMDGVYFYQCLTQEADDVIRPVLELLAKDDHEFFRRLCESIRAETLSNIEEAAFTWRSKRLSDKGFVPLEEALEVYKYLNDRQIASLPKRTGHRQDNEEKVALYPLALGGESYPLLMLALSELKSDPLAEEVKKEIAVIANKVLMADARPITPETVEATLKKVMGFMNIGLEALSGADPHKAGSTLRERWGLHLFQVGYSMVAKLRQRARKFITSGWPSEIGGELAFLDETAVAHITGILRKRPHYFSGTDPASPYREFRNIDEVREVERNIERAEYLGRMFRNVFGLGVRELKELTAERDDLDFMTILLTIWAKGVATGSYRFSPVTENELRSVLRKTWGREVQGSSIRSFRMETSAAFLEWLLKHQPNINTNEERHCRAFVSECFNRLLEEFGELTEKDELDWRYIRSVWTIPEAD